MPETIRYRRELMPGADLQGAHRRWARVGLVRSRPTHRLRGNRREAEVRSLRSWNGWFKVKNPRYSQAPGRGDLFNRPRRS